MLSYRVPVVLVRESTTRSTLGVCEACVCGKPSASQNQWSEAANDGAAFLFNLEVGVVVGMCTCLTLFWGPAWIISRVCCGVSIIARGLWAHTTTFESSSMVSRRLAITKPWPLPPFHIADAGNPRRMVRETCECSAASIGCSGRIPDCCGIVRARLLRDSAYGGWRRRRPLPQCSQHRVLRREESKCLSLWRTIWKCTSYGFLRGIVQRDRC